MLNLRIYLRWLRGVNLRSNFQFFVIDKVINENSGLGYYKYKWKKKISVMLTKINLLNTFMKIIFLHITFICIYIYVILKYIITLVNEKIDYHIYCRTWKLNWFFVDLFNIKCYCYDKN